MKKQTILLLTAFLCADLAFADPAPSARSQKKAKEPASVFNALFPLKQSEDANEKSPAEMAREELKKSLRQSEVISTEAP